LTFFEPEPTKSSGRSNADAAFADITIHDAFGLETAVGANLPGSRSGFVGKQEDA